HHVCNANQRVDHALDTAAMVHVDIGIAVAIENSAGADHVRPAAPDDAVSIGMRVWHVQHSDPRAVYRAVDPIFLGEVRVRRKPGGRKILYLLHPAQHIFLSQDELAGGLISSYADGMP